jgi:ABC-2 type transport system permease protein
VKKTIAIIKREFLTRVKTKGFVIGTLLLPVFILFVTFAPALLTQVNKESTRTIAVIDFSDQLYAPLQEKLETRKQGENASFHLENVITTQENLIETKENLSQRVKKKDLDAFIVIPQNIFKENSFELYAKNVSNISLNETLKGTLSNLVIQMRLQKSGLDPQKINELNRRVDMQTFKVDEKGSKKESGILTFAISYILVFTLYLALIFYGSFVMRGVIEDKNTRVNEMVISSVRPTQLMTGKIIGIGAAGLAQFIIWALFTALITTYGLLVVKQMAPEIEKLGIPSVSASVYIIFVVYFILGYFMYASLFAALGSLVNSESEAQSMQWPLIMPILISFMFIFPTINNPDSPLSVTMSLIPLFSPILMFLRYSVGEAPMHQVGLSFILMIITTWLFIWLTGKIFRIGILMYGKRPTMPQIIKWIRHS